MRRLSDGLGLLIAATIGCSTPVPAPRDAVPGSESSAMSPPLPASTAEASASVVSPPTPPPPPKQAILSGPLAKFAAAVQCKTAAEGANITRALQASKGGATQLVIELRPGSDCALPAVTGVDAALLVVAGSAAADATAEKTPIALGAWDALLLPGLGVRLSSRTTGATFVLAVASREGNELTAALSTGKPWTDRPAEIRRSSLVKTERLSWGSDAFFAHIAFGAPESPHISIEVLSIAAGAAIPEHEHAELELLTVLGGGGSLRIAGSDRQLEPGQQVAIPMKTKHAFTGGSARTVVVQSYAPAGAEQRFKKLAADAATKP